MSSDNRVEASMPGLPTKAQPSVLSVDSLMSGPAKVVNGEDATAAATENTPVQPGNKRKSRPLQRKTSHSLIERRRREKINEGLVSLQSLVPACRDELRETLRTKAHSIKKNARKSKEVLKEEVERDLDAKVASQMVLEKLCIISHTVDYVQELQQKLEAYRRICRCSPPLLGDIDDIHIQHTHDHAHSHDGEQENGEQGSPLEDLDSLGGMSYGDATSSEMDELESPKLQRDSSSSKMIPADGSARISPTETMVYHQQGAPHTHSRCHAKCQRHWGSNNPIKLQSQGHTAAATTKRGRSHTISEQAKPSTDATHLVNIGFETSAAACAATGDTQDEVHGHAEHACCAGESDDSDLEIDEWESTRAVPCTNARYTSLSPRKREHAELEDGKHIRRHMTSLSSGALYTNTTPADDGGHHSPLYKRARTGSAPEWATLPTAGTSHAGNSNCDDCHDDDAAPILPAPLPGIDKMLAPPASSEERTKSGLGLLADLSARNDRPQT